MFTKTLCFLASSMVAFSAVSADMKNVEKSIPLTDGSTLYIFKDGKMGMEDKLGRSTRMKPGHVMETKDGQKLIMVGDEVMRVEAMKETEAGRR